MLTTLIPQPGHTSHTHTDITSNISFNFGNDANTCKIVDWNSINIVIPPSLFCYFKGSPKNLDPSFSSSTSLSVVLFCALGLELTVDFFTQEGISLSQNILAHRCMLHTSILSSLPMKLDSTFLNVFSPLKSF